MPDLGKDVLVGLAVLERGYVFESVFWLIHCLSVNQTTNSAFRSLQNELKHEAGSAAAAVEDDNSSHYKDDSARENDGVNIKK